jgi:hypothetical protein
MPRKVNLIECTDAHMTRSVISRPRKPSFYPSEASAVWKDGAGVTRTAGGCLRASWFRYTGQADPSKVLSPDAYTQWIFALGKAVEQILVEQWKQMGIWVGNNIQFYDEARNISGEIDVLLRDPQTRELYIGEAKSFYGYQATKQVCGNKSTKAEPKTSQMMQALVYVDQFKDLVSYAKLIYYARDSAERNEFDITLVEKDGAHWPCIDGMIDTRFTMENIYARFAELSDYIRAGVMPPPDYEMRWSPEKVEQRHLLGEIAKTTYEKWKKSPKSNPIGDWMCFNPDTLVWMSDGAQKPICEINVGDNVIGLDGPTQVVRVEGKKNTEPCIKIKPACMLDTTCTQDHKWLVARWDTRHRYYSDAPFMLEKIEAQNLKTIDSADRMNLLIPIITESKQVRSLTVEEYRLLGYYAAEGHLGNQQNGRYYQVTFTIHPQEEDLAQDIIRCAQKTFGCHYQDEVITDKRTGFTYRFLRFFSVKFADFIRTKVLGKKAINKTLSSSIMRAPQYGVENFIECAQAGDGCVSTQRNNSQCNTISTSSRILCNQYQQLLWRLSIPARATYSNKPAICFEQYTSAQGYSVDWQGASSILKPVEINKTKFMSTPIRHLELSELSEVWDLEVASCHHLFATESGLASNCRYCAYKNICWPK